MNILKKKGITNIIFTSTVTVYGNTKKLLIDENYKPKPMSVYDKHKHIVNLLLIYSRLLNIKTNILRLNNVYGKSMEIQNQKTEAL